MPVVIKKKKPAYKLEDLRKSDVDLMLQSLSTPEGHFFCFGKAGIKLAALKLIDGENVVTQEGIAVIRNFQ